MNRQMTDNDSLAAMSGQSFVASSFKMNNLKNCLTLFVFSGFFLVLFLFRPVTSSGLERNFFSQSLYPLSVHKSPSHCYRSVGVCVPMNSSQCLDVTLPYRYTYFSYLSSSSSSSTSSSSNSSSSLSIDHRESLSIINHYLARWKGLRSIPQCWKALQSVLCASFFPRCDNDLKHISLPTHEMCLLTRGPCRIIDLYYEWPEFLRCDNQTLFPSKCQNEYTDLKFNISSAAVASRCASPLVSTDDRTIWYPGIDGCALRCNNPIYTEEQHQKASSFIGYGIMFSVAFTGFVVFTFFIDWNSANRYPAIIVFYLNACLLIATLGWVIQFLKGKSEIVCRPDNTTRYGEPSKPDNFLCTFSFVLIYYFSFAALIWFVQLAYVFDFSFKKTDSPHNALQAKSAYFHLTAWSIPLILTIFILLIGEIDGDSMHGICFVGFVNPMVRIVFVFIPLTIGVILGLYYMVKSIMLLYCAKQINDRSTTAKSKKKSRKIYRVIVRITGFAIYVLLALIVSFGSYLYQLHSAEFYRKSLNNFIICNLNISNTLVPNSKAASIFDSSSEANYDSLAISSESSLSSTVNCRRHESPSMTNFYLQLTVCFATCFITSCWVWTANSVASWQRFMNRCFNSDYSNRPVRLKPYETIAKSYIRRQQINQGTYIPSFNSNHNDPVDMDLNSALSQSLSLNFRDNFGALLARRGALPGNEALNSVLDSTGNTISVGIASYHNHRSIASVSNLSVSDVSQQQLSIDSQLSAEQIELAAIVRHQRRKTKKERERFRQIHARMMRRGSDTSGSLAAFALAAAANPNSGHVGKKQANSAVTKSTSTGDLSSLPNGLPNPIRAPAAPILNSGFPFMNHLFPFGGMGPHQQQIHPMLTPHPPSMAAYSHPDHLMHNNYIFPGMGYQFSSVNMGHPVPNGSAFQNNNHTRVAPPRMKPSQLQNSFTFTHGMSDQANQLVNPLEEIRRPDSSFAPTPTANSLGPNLIVTKSAVTSNGHTVNGHNSTGSPFSTAAPTVNGNVNPLTNNGNNFMLNTFAANQMAAGAANMLGPSCNPAQFMFNPAMSHGSDPKQFGPGLPVNGKQPSTAPFQFNPAMSQTNLFGHLNGSANVMENDSNKYAEALQYYNYCWHATSFPELPPHLVNPLNPPQNLAQLDKLIRERQFYHQCRQASMYDSDISQYFPIEMSDSEGMFSDTQQSGAEGGGGGRDPNNRKRFHEQIADTKKMVEDRIQLVEEQAKQTIEQKNGTIDNGIDKELDKECQVATKSQQVNGKQ